MVTDEEVVLQRNLRFWVGKAWN